MITDTRQDREDTYLIQLTAIDIGFNEHGVHAAVDVIAADIKDMIELLSYYSGKKIRFFFIIIRSLKYSMALLPT